MTYLVNVNNPEPRLIVGLVGEVAPDVLVVVYGLLVGPEVFHQFGCHQLTDIPHQCAGVPLKTKGV